MSKKPYILVLFFGLLYQGAIGQKLAVDSALKFETLVLEDDDELNRSFSKRRFIEDGQGYMWVCTELGLYRIDGFSAFNFSKYLNSRFPLLKMPMDVWDFALTDSLVWLGTKQGLYCYDKRLNTCERIFLDSALYPENYRNFVFKLRPENQSLYVQTRNGLYVVKTKSKKVIEKYLTKGERNSNPKWTHHFVKAVYTEISDSTIWIQTYKGLYEINKLTKNKSFYTAPFAKKYDHPFYQGYFIGRNIIMPTYFYGLAYFNLDKKEFTSVKVDPSAPSNATYPNNLKDAVKMNDSTLLIASEMFGLLTYDINARKFTSLNTRKGVEHHLSFDSRGRVWYGLAGLIQHSKKSIIPDHGAKHHLNISSIWSENEKIALPSIEPNKSLQLNEHQKNILVYLSVTQSYYLDSPKFEYQLNKGKWKSIGSAHSFYLENIKHGEHEILIRAKENNKTIDELTYNFSLKIPFYKRTWFILLSIFLVILTIVLAYKWRISKLKQQQEERLEFERQIVELENIAFRNQMNPHFMFNSINSIKGLIINEAAEAAADQLTRFSKLMRSTLNYSSEKLISLSQEIEFLKIYSELERCKGKNPVELSFEVEASMEADHTFIIPFLLQPFVENAFKHAFHEMGNHSPLIHISFKKEGGMLQVTIEDNGIGVKNENATIHVSKGTVLVEKRLELHNKKSDNVRIEFKGKNNGTKAALTIRM